jgi:hypothetical protein
MNNEARANRLAGWNGLVFSVLSLIVIPLVVTPPPALGATGEAFAAWYTQHRAGFLLGNYLGIVAFIPGFVQLAVLAARIRAREGAGGWLGPFVLASGTFAYAVFACSLVAFQALPFLVDPGASQAMFAVGTLGAVWFALDGLAAIPMILAVGWAALATQALPRWFAHLSWPLAALALLMSFGGLVEEPAWLAGGGAATFAGFVAFFAWTFALGVLFLRAGRSG